MCGRGKLKFSGGGPEEAPAHGVEGAERDRVDEGRAEDAEAVADEPDTSPHPSAGSRGAVRKKEVSFF